MVQVIGENGTSEVRYNKKDEILELNENGDITAIDLKAQDETIDKKGDFQTLASTTLREAREYAYGYYYKVSLHGGRDQYWDVGNGKGGKYIKQTSKNSSKLEDFEDIVDTLIGSEMKFAGANCTL